MVYHDGLKDLDFVDITVIGYLRQVGCTGGGGDAGVDAISLGKFTKADCFTFAVAAGELLITNVVGPVGFLSVILLVWL